MSGPNPVSCCQKLDAEKGRKGPNANHCDRAYVPGSVFVGSPRYDCGSVPWSRLCALEPEPQPRAAVCFRIPASGTEEPHRFSEFLSAQLKQFEKDLVQLHWERKLERKYYFGKPTSYHSQSGFLQIRTRTGFQSKASHVVPQA
jgi:hypothetical protein